MNRTIVLCVLLKEDVSIADSSIPGFHIQNNQIIWG